VVITAAAAEETLTVAPTEGTLHSDFLISFLDLQLMVTLLVGRDKSALEDTEVLQSVGWLLWSNPQTYACVLVADDERLSSRIVEGGEEFEGYTHSAVRDHGQRQGPVRETVTAYLRTINLAWPQPPILVSHGRLNFEEATTQASLDALRERKASRTSIPERRQARDSLNLDDATWAAKLALATISGTAIEIEALFDGRSAGEIR
jgi:hypothetical protein